MDLLSLENRTIYLLREAYFRLPRLGMLWSMGKDSTALLWMVKKAFGTIPFPVFNIDESFEPQEVIDFRQRLEREWQIPLQVYQNTEALAQGMSPCKGRQVCCKALKTEPLKKLIKDHQLQGLIIGVRRDEEGSRSKERVFSPRMKDQSWSIEDQPPEIFDLFVTDLPGVDHYRVHPMLDWTELMVWQYIQEEQIPFCSLYLAKEGKRYRSLGCAPCTFPVESRAENLDQIIEDLKSTKVSERAGRSQDHEVRFGLQKLRLEGYM